MILGAKTFGNASCKLSTTKQLPVDMREHVVQLSHLYCDPEHRGQGDATELVSMVCREADDANKTLLVHVQPYGEIELSRSQLSEWYAKHFGFTPIQAEPLLMARMPGSTPRTLTPIAEAILQ